MAEPQDKWKEGRAEIDDGWFSPISWEKAKGADIFVLHSFIPEEMKKLGKKMVAVLHGPSEHMLLKEWTTERKEDAFNLHINILWKYDATVVINQHEFDIMEMYDEKGRLHYIPNSIDLDRYRGEGQMKWEYKNHPAIGSFDVHRLEKLPAHIIWAMPRIAKRIPTARLNLFSMALEPISTWRNIYCRSKERRLEHLCETIQLENNNLAPFMRGIDIGFNNNMSGIASRVTMEMMAMGVPVVSYNGDYTKYHAKIWDLDSIAEQVERCWADLSGPDSTLRADTKKYAEDNFDREKEVKKYVELYNKVLGG
jgi:glycosyltransferase involved in cell wall biosynthesis